LVMEGGAMRRSSREKSLLFRKGGGGTLLGDREATGKEGLPE